MVLNRRQYLWCFFFCLVIFAGGFLIASLVTLPEFSLLSEAPKADVSVVKRLRTFSTFKLILFNNSRVFLVLTLGILTCGILSVMFSFLIGGVVGFSIKLALGYGGTIPLVLATLVPHGVFELTAFLSIAAIGIYFPLRVYSHIEGHPVDWVKEAKSYGLVALGAYVVVFFAALIEAFITPVIAANFVP